MNTVLIIYPHWPPSNLAGVHRPRLIGNYLTAFNWHPLVLTVESQFYEEPPDHDIVKTVSKDIEVIYTKARPVKSSSRLIGDIGIRGFDFIYKKAREIIQTRKIDFIWIPIPSFYMALMGRLLYAKTKVPYGIDYIDPWARPLALHENRFSKAWMARIVASILEPIAVKNASLISGVSKEYYQPVLDRNFKNKKVKDVAMPYGFDPNDHAIDIPELSLPWKENERVLIYAGAFLPKAHMFMEAMFKGLQNLKNAGDLPNNLRLCFLGTGKYGGKSIEEYAKENNMQKETTEIRDRFPFLHILNFLSKANAVLVIGSTEKHYTASKTFQALLSGKPVIAAFHEMSSAVSFMNSSNAGDYLSQYKEEDSMENMVDKIQTTLEKYFKDPVNWKPDLSTLDQYSSKQSAKVLAEAMDEIVKS